MMNYFHIVGIGLGAVLIYYIVLDVYIHTRVKNDIINEFAKDAEGESEEVRKVIDKVLVSLGKKKVSELQ
jgi:ferritin-like protein